MEGGEFVLVDEASHITLPTPVTYIMLSVSLKSSSSFWCMVEVLGINFAFISV